MCICDIRLTEREKRDREHKKQLLNIAKQHENARELERVQRYHMPQDKKGEKGKYITLFQRLQNIDYSFLLCNI